MLRSTLAFLILVATASPTPAQEPVSVLARADLTQGSEEALNARVLDLPAGLIVENVSLAEALEALRNATGAPLAFSPTRMKGEGPVSCFCEGMTVGEALRVMLFGTDFHFVEVGDRILVERKAPAVDAPDELRAQLAKMTLRTGGNLNRHLTLRTLPARSTIQTGTVEGRVVEAGTGRPLAGTQIQIVGTGLGGLAASDGRFSIPDVPAGEVEVRVQRIGYRTVTQTVTVQADETVFLEFELREEALGLDEIVVTGTAGGTQRRALGNVVGRISAPDLLEASPSINLEQLMSQRVPGVMVMPGSGNLGSGGVTRIRGVSSISLNMQPLIYVDGVRMDNNPAGGPPIRQGRQMSRLNDINPEEIESIEVIKGPAAATLYGTEAANGVIQIITKRGSTGAPSWDVRMRQGATWLMDPAGKAPTVYSTDPVTGELLSVNLVEREKAAGRDIFQYGRLQSYGLSVQGGTDQIRYFLSTDWSDEEGIVDYNWQERLSARANIGLIPSETLEINANLGYVQSDTRFAQAAAGWGIWDQIVWGSPARLDTPTRGFLRVTPEAAGEIESLSQLHRFTGSVQMTYRLREWLVQRLQVGTDVGDEENSRLFPRHPDGTAHFFGGASLGDKFLERRRNVYNTLDYSTTAGWQVTPSLHSGSSFGFQYYTRQTNVVTATGREFPAPTVTSVGGAAVTFGNESHVENKTAGIYFQQQFDWESRAFLTAAVRADDNSAFGEDFEAVIYPKVSATWVMHEEPFWNLERVSALRLRGAYGLAGQQPNVFDALRRYTPTTGPGDAATMTPQSVGNPALKPERGEELEAGFDLALLDDRLSLEVTHYRQRTKDAIVSSAVPISMGFPGSQIVNLGEIRNWGTEYALEARILQRRNVGWDVGFSFHRNKNRVESLGGNPPTATIREGYPISSIFHERIVHAELDQEGNPTNLRCDGGPENDHQPVSCADAPTVFWGQAHPTWEGGVRNTITLMDGALQLYAFLDFKGGHMMDHGDIGASHSTFGNSRAFNEANDPVLLGYERVVGTDALGYFDAGVAKLREVSATYRMPSAWAGRFRASQASITMAGRNFWTLWVAQDEIFGHPIPDPEMRTPASVRGIRVQTVLPPISQFVTTVRVTF